MRRHISCFFRKPRIRRTPPENAIFIIDFQNTNYICRIFRRSSVIPLTFKNIPKSLDSSPLEGRGAVKSVNYASPDLRLIKLIMTSPLRGFEIVFTRVAVNFHGFHGSCCTYQNFCIFLQPQLSDRNRSQTLLSSSVG